MRLFDINGTDFTTFITAPSYKVNSLDVYEEWTDANKITHRDVVRTRVSGGFTLKFETKQEYDSFFTIYNTNKAPGGYITATLFINNLGTSLTKNVFLEMEPANTIPFFGAKSYDGFEVTVRER